MSDIRTIEVREASNGFVVEWNKPYKRKEFSTDEEEPTSGIMVFKTLPQVNYFIKEFLK